MRNALSIAVVIGAALGLILPETGPLSQAEERAAVRAETLVSSGEPRAEWIRGR